MLAEVAGSLTFGKLRSSAHRLVLELDPESAERRKETAKQDAHVRKFREDSGNAGMVAREFPPDEVLASWQHVEQRALDLGPPASPAPCKNSASGRTWIVAGARQPPGAGPSRQHRSADTSARMTPESPAARRTTATGGPPPPRPGWRQRSRRTRQQPGRQRLPPPAAARTPGPASPRW